MCVYRCCTERERERQRESVTQRECFPSSYVVAWNQGKKGVGVVFLFLAG